MKRFLSMWTTILKDLFAICNLKNVYALFFVSLKSGSLAIILCGASANFDTRLNFSHEYLMIYELIYPPPSFFSLIKKVKFFIYCAILMKFEIQHFYMLSNNNWDRYLWLGAPNPGFPPPHFLKKFKFFIYGAIWLKFETAFSYVY